MMNLYYRYSSTQLKSALNSLISPAAAALLLTTTASWSAEVDTSKWLCESCPFETGYQSEVSADIQHVSDDAVKFGDATGYDEQGVYVNLDGEGLYTSDKQRINWSIEDLGLSSRALEADGGRPGTYGYQLAYRELPHRLFDTTSTVFTANGNDELLLPSDWISSGLTSGFTTLDGILRPVTIESDRQGIMLGGHYRPSSRFKLNAEYRHEERDGNDILSGAFFTQASLLPRVLDYQTDDVDLGVSYLGTRGSVSLDYHVALFQNKSWALTWDNPFTAAAGADRGRLAQAPDNQFQQVSLAGNYHFETYDAVLAATTAFGRIRQNDQLLPYTLNTNLITPALPRATLDGKVDTTNVALSFFARPHRKAQVRMGYRHAERDNNTPRDQWQRVIVDSFTSGDIETNTPYSFKRVKFNVNAAVDLIDKVKVYGGYDRTEMDRDFQEVAEQTEHDTWGQVRWRPRPQWEIRFKGGVAKREIDRIDASVTNSVGQNPLLRKYNLAYRYREYGDLTLLASLPEAPVSFGASIRFANDNYSQSTLGLQESDDLSYSADIDWAVNEQTSFFVNGGWDRIEARQNGSELFGASDWQATHDDRFFTTSAGLIIKGINEHIDLLFDYTHADGSSAITMNSANSGQSVFPDLESTRDTVRLNLSYRKSPRLSLDMELLYEDYSSSDWALDGVAPGTIPAELSLGADPYNYDIFVIGVGFNYSFGESRTTLQE